MPYSSLSEILAKKGKYLNVAQNRGPRSKKVNKPKFETLEQALITWFTQARGQGIPVDGPIVKEKAREIALRMGIQNFTASNGWLSRFRKRNGLRFKKICGESRSAPVADVDFWKNEVLPQIFKDYKPEDV